jgi:uncharacterized membrane protein
MSDFTINFMKMRPNDIRGAVEAGILSAEQAQQLQNYLKQCAHQHPGFQLTHILYYLGGLIAIGAMTLFMNLGWDIWLTAYLPIASYFPLSYPPSA